jgi:hypothetical protein
VLFKKLPFSAASFGDLRRKEGVDNVWWPSGDDFVTVRQRQPYSAMFVEGEVGKESAMLLIGKRHLWAAVVGFCMLLLASAPAQTADDLQVIAWTTSETSFQLINLEKCEVTGLKFAAASLLTMTGNKVLLDGERIYITTVARLPVGGTVDVSVRNMKNKEGKPMSTTKAADVYFLSGTACGKVKSMQLRVVPAKP